MSEQVGSPDVAKDGRAGGLCEPAALLLAASIPFAGRLHEGWKIPAGQDTAAIAAACYRVSHMGRHVTGLVKGSDITLCLCHAL